MRRLIISVMSKLSKLFSAAASKSGRFLELPAYAILRNSRNYVIFSLIEENFNQANYYKLFKYKNHNAYVKKQESKTARRLRYFKEAKKSILWTRKENIEQLAVIIRNRFFDEKISGLCMGSRSGEEQILFQEFLGNSSEVQGIELEKSAQFLPNTIICDFHNLPAELTETQDFVYSNSHDQSNNPKVAFSEWIRVLRSGGLLILEHSRSHGKLHQGSQDPFGIESELLPFILLTWFPNQIHLELILEPTAEHNAFHYFFVFKKV